MYSFFTSFSSSDLLTLRTRRNVLISYENNNEVTIEHDDVKASYEKYLAIKEELYPNKNRPLTLMDLATVGAKYLKRTGKLKNLDESEEINACSVKINVKLDDGKTEKWLFRGSIDRILLEAYFRKVQFFSSEKRCRK